MASQSQIQNLDPTKFKISIHENFQIERIANSTTKNEYIKHVKCFLDMVKSRDSFKNKYGPQVKKISDECKKYSKEVINQEDWKNFNYKQHRRVFAIIIEYLRTREGENRTLVIE